MWWEREMCGRRGYGENSTLAECRNSSRTWKEKRVMLTCTLFRHGELKISEE